MKKELATAIIGAISAYIQQEEVTRAFTNTPVPHADVNAWQLFNRQELVRARTNWRINRVSKLI